MPCALRTRPTIVRSGAVTSLARRGVRRRFAHGDCGRVELAREPRLVARLEQPCLPEEGAHGVRRQRADIEPIIRPLAVELDGLVALARIVLADDLDEAAVPRARRLGDDDAER